MKYEIVNDDICKRRNKDVLCCSQMQILFGSLCHHAALFQEAQCGGNYVWGKSEKQIVGNLRSQLWEIRLLCLSGCQGVTVSIAPLSLHPSHLAVSQKVQIQSFEISWDLTFISAPFSVGYLFKIWSQPCLGVKKAGLDSLSRGSFCVSEWEADLAFVRCQHFAAPARPRQTYFHCIVSS